MLFIKSINLLKSEKKRMLVIEQQSGPNIHKTVTKSAWIDKSSTL